MPDTQWIPKINAVLCTGCGDCVATCPMGALVLQSQKAVLAFPDACTYCGVCEDICPVSAIELPLLICRVGEAR